MPSVPRTINVFINFLCSVHVYNNPLFLFLVFAKGVEKERKKVHNFGRVVAGVIRHTSEPGHSIAYVTSLPSFIGTNNIIVIITNDTKY